MKMTLRPPRAPQAVQCDVSVEEDDHQEWTFTLYGFDNSGKATREVMVWRWRQTDEEARVPRWGHGWALQAGGEAGSFPGSGCGEGATAGQDPGHQQGRLEPRLSPL